MTFIQEIIISYVYAFGNINAQEMRHLIGEPSDLIADEALRLFDRGIFRSENGRVFIVEEMLEEPIIPWDSLVANTYPGDDFNPDNDYDFRKGRAGEITCIDERRIEQILQIENINIASYHIFTIHSHGKEREICAPSWNLKKRQMWILKHILNDYKPPECVHGFVKGKSIVTNASCHCGANEVGCIDIKDFFPSIDVQRVKIIFGALGYDEKVSALLANLCTYDGRLPQGAPTSPMISNIVLYEFDKEIMEYALKNRIVYSRYADDITISGSSNITNHLHEVQKRLVKYGFVINEKKTRVMVGKHRKIVTGVVVSDKVRVPKRYKRRFEQELYYCYKFGVLQHIKNIGRVSAVNFEEYMYGKAYYIKMVEPEMGEKYLRQLDVIFFNSSALNMSDKS